HFASVIGSVGTDDIAKILEPRHQSTGSGRSVLHFLRDGGHGQHFLLVKAGKEKELREGNIARRQLLGETQQKAALHFHHKVSKLFCVPAQLTSLLVVISRSCPHV